MLEKLGGMDLSAEALPFMAWAEGELAGVPARVHRISFSGELSFEIAVPAGRIGALWEAGGWRRARSPYGTEAMHVLRAEKGYVMIGEETDGTVIPQDLGLGWAISKKKPDFLGKRAQMRSHMARRPLAARGARDAGRLGAPRGHLRPRRAGENANGQRNAEGRITSTYCSPTLGRGIAMALVHARAGADGRDAGPAAARRDRAPRRGSSTGALRQGGGEPADWLRSSRHGSERRGEARCAARA